MILHTPLLKDTSLYYSTLVLQDPEILQFWWFLCFAPKYKNYFSISELVAIHELIIS